MEKEDKVIYKNLSYKIVGILFEVYNELGYGFQEKYYEKAIAKSLSNKGISFKRQVSNDILYKGDIIGKYYLDFLIENKVILELKVGKYFKKQDFSQVKNYLQVTGKKLAILAIFTYKGVRFIRILNLNDKRFEIHKTFLDMGKIRKLYRY